jgi:hypothetical protein
MPINPGRLRYELNRPVPICPKGLVVDPAAEDPPRSPFRIPESPDVVPESPDVDDVDERGDARLCSPVVSEEIRCDSVDCTPAPVDAPAVWLPAAPCAANPDRLVVSGAATNGVTCAVVAAELAA